MPSPLLDKLIDRTTYRQSEIANKRERLNPGGLAHRYTKLKQDFTSKIDIPNPVPGNRARGRYPVIPRD